ncbi:MarR family winged helix-turn-helix transcriptional regulator [Mucilaginibacter ginsenosidivorax]|uniref:MarR family transcriptional regulator n=1 Tax=Mucilaginibacter ginsenosidivorax TaxID=862126 RepID=A0A5B8W428_9SPHI|nr:MarR family winged helix-turn-helix transcriptional regulator [Mucilaginibacter ginsenosidivorax]QEC77646.1 MarR family transcriptional regulator [Mucilaginibacter ginsenosidivorax]
MNVIDESGILAISTRLQRLADTLRKDGVLIYKANNIDFEPKWFPVIYTLHYKPVLSVVELANEIGYTHPSTISLLKELEKEKLIRSKKDKADERKRLVLLTAKGQELVERMRPVWAIIKAAAAELTNTQNNIMKAIDEVEEQISLQSFFARAQRLKSEGKQMD